MPIHTAHQNHALLQVRQLHFGYTPQQPLLQDLNLDLESGTRTGIIGENGSGKSTLFLLLSGVLRPDNGEIHLHQDSIRPAKFNPRIGLVFQNPDDQLINPSVREDVAFGPRNLGLDETEVRKRVQEALEQTGCTHLAEQIPHRLSGGEKRMVSIAGVLAMKPELVLYDEPSASLDHRARRRLISYLQTATESMLIASHDLNFLNEVCTRILVLANGHIVAQGSPSEILFADPFLQIHGFEALGTPFTTQSSSSQRQRLRAWEFGFPE